MSTGTARLSWLGLITVTLICAGVLGVFIEADPERGPWIGGGLLILYMLIVRWAFTRDHRIGMWHVLNHDYETAIPRFEASFRFHSRHRWVDRLRYVLLLSPTGFSHREMAMTSLGYCHGQLGHAEARDWYERCTREYPKNLGAAAALNLIRTGQRIGAAAG